MSELRTTAPVTCEQYPFPDLALIKPEVGMILYRADLLIEGEGAELLGGKLVTPWLTFDVYIVDKITSCGAWLVRVKTGKRVWRRFVSRFAAPDRKIATQQLLARKAYRVRVTLSRMAILADALNFISEKHMSKETF